MEQLIKSTAAYKIFCSEVKSGRLSHAYMLYFADGANLRAALKLFALEFFFAAKGSREEKLILSEALPDTKICPAEGTKLTVSAAAALISDAALKPLEYDKKLYIISGFESAAPVFQNKLLKILEEPPRGVYFLLGASSLAPILATVRSRVKLLEIPPFTEGEILSALNRVGDNPMNSQAARACGGVFGVAKEMVRGEWYKEVKSAAEELCRAATVGSATAAALKYGDCKYKTELLAEMQRIYFGELKRYAQGDTYRSALTAGAVSYAANAIGEALRDVRFNANFSSLLYDLTLKVALENEKWLKL